MLATVGLYAVHVLSLLIATPISIPYEKLTLLENGLEVILSEDHTLPICAVNVWYHAGPINESVGRTGFAHLFEHLMFQGSKHVGDDQHFAILESRGATAINGTTGYDRTNYFETVPSNELELALWLESDRMGFLMDTFHQDKLDNQRDVVMNERRQTLENVPYGPSYEQLIHLLFEANHPYYGIVIGSMDDLKAASVDDVIAFYKHYYSPRNATIAIVGDFDSKEVKGWINKYFASLSDRPTPIVERFATKPIEAEKRLQVKEPVSLSRIQMAWHSPSAYSEGDAEADVLAMLLGGGKSSRLYQKLVYELELASDIQVSQDSLALVSIFTILATAKPGVAIEKIEKVIEQEIQKIKTTPASEQEIQRIRNQIETQTLIAMQNVGGFSGKADILNRYNQHLGDPGYLNSDLLRYKAVTPEKVTALATSLLQKDQRVVLITVPST